MSQQEESGRIASASGASTSDLDERPVDSGCFHGARLHDEAQASLVNRRASTGVRPRLVPPVVNYLVVRVAWGLAGLFLLSVVIFAATHLLSDDPAKAMLGARATPERVAELNKELGLDRPIREQYVDWIKAALSGDLGKSSAAVVVGNTGDEALVSNLLRINPRDGTNTRQLIELTPSLALSSKTPAP